MPARKQSIQFLLMFLFGLGSQISTAANRPTHYDDDSGLYSDFAYAHSNYVTTLSILPGWEMNGQDRTITLTNGVNTTQGYYPRADKNVVLNWELFFGRQLWLNDRFLGQLGLDIGTTGNANLAGVIIDSSNSIVANYTYGYQVKHSYIALKGKLLADTNYIVTPWVSLGLGVGLNQANQFTISPTSVTGQSPPNFISHTESAFTYTLGIGVQRKLTKHWHLGVGYEFIDWGASKLLPGANVNNPLTASRLNFNELVMNFTYLA